MKRILLIGSVLYCSSLLAQPIKLSGTLASAAGKSLELSNLNEQKWTVQADSSGKFSQSFSDIEKGYYSLSGVGAVYLAPGFDLNITKEKDKILFRGKGNIENNLIVTLNNNIRQLSEEVKEGKMNMVSFPDFQKKMENWKQQQYLLISKTKIKDPAFAAHRRGDIDYAARNIVRDYTYVYGVDMKKRDNFFALMQKMAGNFDRAKLDSARNEMEVKKLTRAERDAIDSINHLGTSMNDEALFKASAIYRRWMDQEIGALIYKPKYRDDFNKGAKSEAIQSKVVGNEISNAFIREYWQYDIASIALKMSEDLAEADSIYAAYSAIARNNNYSSIVNGIYAKIKKFTKGAPAPDFNFRTVSGEKISLASLRGNIVYIDVWATWCGPCKAEIPHLKKVEANYHGKPISFVSISVDELKDTDKWIAYVTDNNLKGVQLMADNAFNSTFIQEFNIAAIPRFIMIDKEGKIISANAMRPSNKKLSEELDKYLAL
ncbi:TlpA family protein disulfide reductase [Pseudobacter ginsenosidimutans]|uniref:Thiol-disulfide isomerase/thioredoxin n=1 Tax=Pseudobacter ginsenosidimutans TaxID=661488 RepID=A0A4Q7MQM3_9BACT|nr:TlpA disulfide reductase family protein [Pseudobacter ginsenosidimutans]RZS70837.1 thiol-disulfide isomerase/thioredoxin [Pseudobacter ginsenosidimutans]